MAKRGKKKWGITAKTIVIGKELPLMQPPDGKYVVASNTKPNECYYVDSELGCQCEGYKYRGECSHYECLKNYLAKKGHS